MTKRFEHDPSSAQERLDNEIKRRYVIRNIRSVLDKASISAIRASILLAQQSSGTWSSHRRLAESLGESPTYLPKVLRHLVKHGILTAGRGARGGVRLACPPDQITLLAIVEACQGSIPAGYCRSARPPSSYCAFHRATHELRQAITETLSRWSLASLAGIGESAHQGMGGVTCLMPPPPVVVPAASAREGQR